MTKEEILEDKIYEDKCHSIDPFEVYENTKKAALKAMDEYAKQEAIAFSDFCTDRRRLGGIEERPDENTYSLYLQSKTIKNE